MMGCECHVACMEGMLCVTSRGGHDRPDELESRMEGMAGADKMCVILVQG